jgi:hypothetical protein
MCIYNESTCFCVFLKKLVLIGLCAHYSIYVIAMCCECHLFQASPSYMLLDFLFLSRV